MTDTDTQKNTQPNQGAKTAQDSSNGPDKRKRNKRRSQDKRGKRGDRSQQEFDQKIIDIRRVTRVVSGGRRFSFSVAMVIGDRQGRVGVGLGKSGDTSLAITKAVRDAKKNMIKVQLAENKSIPFDVHAKFKASELEMFPAPGRGLVAGSSVRDVLELAGITDINAKLLSRSKNKINNARVTLEALKTFGSVVKK